MEKKQRLLRLFDTYLDKQDLLDKLTENSKLDEYGYSEIHTIAAIEDLDEPNVTEISKCLNMTRGAISKITKKLQEKKLIESYTREGNKQKIFFKLTDAGMDLYKEHAKGHKLWEERDLKFFGKYSNRQLEIIEAFMNEYNQYLDEKAEEIMEEEVVR